jgi:surface antigen
VALPPRPPRRRSGYTRSVEVRPWRYAAGLPEQYPRRLPHLVSALARRSATAALLLWVAACSLPEQAAAIRGLDHDGDVTGTLAAEQMGEATGITNSDIAAAGGAASALFEQDSAATARWENPLTGASGTVSALASAYRDGGETCRDFLSSYVRLKSQAWLQGEACLAGSGRWNVRDLRRWTRS